MGERELCKLEAMGSIPFTSTIKFLVTPDMKKLFLALCAVFVLSLPVAADAGCTAQDFQKEVMDMQTTMTELSKSSDKMTKANAAMEKEFQAEILDFAKLAQTAAGDPAKTQEMLDKGCVLYGRINKKLNEFK